MPVLDYLRRWILGEDEEPEQKFVPVPSFTPRAEPFDFPSSVALDNLGTDIERQVVSPKPLTGPVDDRPRIGPTRAPTVEEQLAEIRAQTGVPEAPVITGPGDLAREQLKVDQRAQELANPVLDTAWDKASEIGSGVEDASMQGLQEIALHPQGLFGDAPARLVGSMLPSSEVGPDGMPLRDEEGRLQGFPLKRAAVNFLNFATLQHPYIRPDEGGQMQQGFVPGMVQSFNETAGEALTDPSDMALGAATLGLGGKAEKVLSALQFPAMADSAKGAYDQYQALPNKGLNTETGKALASLITQGGMAAAAGKQLGDTVLEPVSQLYGVEGPKFDPEKLTEAALAGDGMINMEGSKPSVPDIAAITTEREKRAGTSQSSSYRNENKGLKNLTDEEVVALDRYTDGLSGTYGSQIKSTLQRFLENTDWGSTDSARFELLRKIQNKIDNIDTRDPNMHSVLAYGYEGLKEMDPTLRDPILKKIAQLLGNNSFIPDKTTWPGDPDMAKIYMKGVTGRDRYNAQVIEGLRKKREQRNAELLEKVRGQHVDALWGRDKLDLYTLWNELPEETRKEHGNIFNNYLKSIGVRFGEEEATNPFEESQAVEKKLEDVESNNPDGTVNDVLSKLPTEGEILSPSPYYQKGYADFNFKHSQPVKVTFPDGTVHYDEVKGLNQGHALYEAQKNWEGAKVEPISKQELDSSGGEQLRIEEELPTENELPVYITGDKWIGLREDVQKIGESKGLGRSKMEKYPITRIPDSEYAKSDANPEYVPREEIVAYIEAPSERHVEKKLAQLIKSGELQKNDMYMSPGNKPFIDVKPKEQLRVEDELEPVEPMEQVHVDELVHEDVPTPLADVVKSEATDLMDQAHEGKIADALAESIADARSKTTQEVNVDETFHNTLASAPHAISPITAKVLEIGNIVKDTLSRLGITTAREIKYGKNPYVNSLGYVRTTEGASGPIYLTPESLATNALRRLFREKKPFTKENITRAYAEEIATTIIHESLHQTSSLGHSKNASKFDPDTPAVATDELGNITDIGETVGTDEGKDFNALENLSYLNQSKLIEMVAETFKDQLKAQDIINIADWKGSKDGQRLQKLGMPTKTLTYPTTPRPDPTRRTEALMTQKDPGPDGGFTPVGKIKQPASASSDPLDHISVIRNTLRDGKTVDFQTFIDSLPDDLKSQGPEIWKEALSDPDKIISTAKHPLTSLINLVNARYPGGSLDAQIKILTRMITTSKFLDPAMQSRMIANLKYHTKRLTGKPTAPATPSGNKPPSTPAGNQPPKGPTPPASAPSNRFVKNPVDYIRYNQAIPIRQDQVAQNFEHLPKGLQSILAYEANPQAVAPDLAAFFDKLYKEQVDAGVQIDYTEDYLHHAYEGTPAQMAAYRAWLDSQGKRSISLKPGHTLNRIFDTYQEAMKFGLKPKFSNLADIAALYYGKARRAILDAELVNYLKTTTDPKTGEPLLSKVRRPGYSPIVNFPGSRIPTKDGYVHVEYYAPTEIATQINNFHSDAMLPLKIVSSLASKTRNLMLGAGIPGTWINMHGLNIENRFAMSGLPDSHIKSTIEGLSDAFKMLKDPTGEGMEQDLSQSLEEMATMVEKGGVVIRPRRFYYNAVVKGLSEALGDVAGTGIPQVDEAAAKIPGGLEAAKMFGKAGTIIEHLFDKPLFERMVPFAMKQRYFEHFTELVNQGMDEETAHNQAGDFINTMFGVDNWQASTNTMWNNPNTQAVLQSLILAPQWFGSNVKMAKRIPKAMLDGNSPQAKMYRGYAKKFMTLFILGQMFGAGGTGGSEFQIPAGDVDDEHERQLRPFGTSQDWARLPFELLHKAYTRGNWDEAAKLLRNRIHPFVRSGLELLTGQDTYTKQQLFGSNVPEGRKLLNYGKVLTDPFRPSQVDASWELLKKVTPLGDWSEENSLGRVKTLEEIGYDFTEAPVGVYEKRKPAETPPFELFNFRSQRKKSRKRSGRIEAP